MFLSLSSVNSLCKLQSKKRKKKDTQRLKITVSAGLSTLFNKEENDEYPTFWLYFSVSGNQTINQKPRSPEFITS